MFMVCTPTVEGALTFQVKVWGLAQATWFQLNVVPAGSVTMVQPSALGAALVEVSSITPSICPAACCPPLTVTAIVICCPGEGVVVLGTAVKVAVLAELWHPHWLIV
jgi:hypothetical protein